MRAGGRADRVVGRLRAAAGKAASLGQQGGHLACFRQVHIPHLPGSIAKQSAISHGDMPLPERVGDIVVRRPFPREAAQQRCQQPRKLRDSPRRRPARAQNIWEGHATVELRAQNLRQSFVPSRGHAQRVPLRPRDPAPFQGPPCGGRHGKPGGMHCLMSKPGGKPGGMS